MIGDEALGDEALGAHVPHANDEYNPNNRLAIKRSNNKSVINF